MKRKWNLENAISVINSNGFKSVHERAFRKKYPGLVKAIVKNKWEESLGLIKQREPLTFDKCYEVALTVSSKSQLRTVNKSIDNACRKNNWFKYFTWFENLPNVYGNINEVYGYFFPEFNAVYIGRTYLHNRRDYQHNTDENDTVFKFAREHGVAVPLPIVLEKKLSLKQSVFLETFYTEKYKTEGMVVLNKAKPGSVGAAGNGYLTYSHCYKCAEQFKSYKMFRLSCPNEYYKSQRMKWLDDYTWLTGRNNIAKKVYQYTIDGVFVKDYTSANAAAKENGFSKGNIISGANGKYGKSNTPYGYVWSYAPLEV